MKKKNKVLLVILAVIVALTAAAFYFLPIGLIVHTLWVFTKEDGHPIEVRLNDDTIHFALNGQHMVFEAEVDGQSDSLIYDTGVNVAFVMMYTPSTQPEGMKFYHNRTTGADKKSRIKMTTFPVKWGTRRVSNIGVGFAMLNPEPSPCEKYTISKYHLLGFQGFQLSRNMIDFTASKMYTIPDSVLIDTAVFVPIKCRLNRGVLFVYPKVNGVEYECIFDTGNGNCGFLLKDEQRIENPKENDWVYEGSYGNTIGGLTERQRFVRVPKVTFNLVGPDKEVDVSYVKDLPFHNMGLKAISQYDWIFDWDRGGDVKVYARPHEAEEKAPVDMFRYKLNTADGTLKILTRLIDGNEKFKVGDQIISVNGEKITEENICHYYELLTESKDWSGFEIRVK